MTTRVQRDGARLRWLHLTDDPPLDRGAPTPTAVSAVDRGRSKSPEGARSGRARLHADSGAGQRMFVLHRLLPPHGSGAPGVAVAKSNAALATVYKMMRFDISASSAGTL